MITTWSVRDSQFHYATSDASRAFEVRTLVREYLLEHCQADSDVSSAEVIVGELLGNVVKHAPGSLGVRISARDGAALLEVADEGSGYTLNLTLPDDSFESQRGLFIVAALGSDLRVARRGNGTVTSVILPVVFKSRFAVHGDWGTCRYFDPADRAEAHAQVDALQSMMSLHHRSIVPHMEDVAALAKRLATALRLPQDVVFRCHLAARIHDLGLNGVSDEILRAPGPLSTSDRFLIEQHPIAGSAIASASRSLAEVAAIVRGHHERMDGTGYPDGLLRDQIPIESRIIAIVDTFVTMTGQQAHRPISSPTHAMRELFENDGQFDPNVVRAFATLLGFDAARSDIA